MTDYDQPLVHLPHYLRLLLVEQICLNMDIIAYLNHNMGFKLVHEVGSHYKGKCPFCRQKEVFTLSKTFGTCTCKNCRKVSDFLDMLSYSNSWDLNQTLEFLSDYLEKAEYGFCAASGGAA